MRETRPSGLEGGATRSTCRPYPYQGRCSYGRLLSKMLPEGVELKMAAINGDDTDTLRYLQTLKPFWPETMVAVGE